MSVSNREKVEPRVYVIRYEQIWKLSLRFYRTLIYHFLNIKIHLLLIFGQFKVSSLRYVHIFVTSDHNRVYILCIISTFLLLPDIGSGISPKNPASVDSTDR